MNSQYSPQTYSSNQEISMADIMKTLKARSTLIAFLTITFSSAAAILAFSLPSVYSATAVIAPVGDGKSSSGLSALTGQFGGLAALAGVSMGNSASSNEAVATLNSRALTERFIQSNNLLPVLFEREWDATRRDWRKSGEEQPTLWKATEFFNKKVRFISEDKKNGLVTVKVEWSDPALAADWAMGLVTLSNKILRDRAISESNRNLSYLNDQLQKTNVHELRQAIYRLIEAEVKNVMIAQGGQEFAFKIIDPAVKPERKIRPKRITIILGGLVTGFIFASFLAMLPRYALNKA